MKGFVGWEVVLVGSWGWLPKSTHVLGSHVNRKAIKAYMMEEKREREVLRRSRCKASYSSSYSVSAEALHFLYLVC